MSIVSWPSGVNRIVTSEASIDIASSGVKSDTSENGSEMSRLTCSQAPDKWSVSMTFSNGKDLFYQKHGKTEWKAFCDWFKHTTMNGVLPFYFSKIDDPSDTTEAAVYKISSNGLPKGNPFGDQMKVTMTWIEQFTDVISVPEVTVDADYIDLSNGLIDFRFTEQPEDTPSKDDFTVTYSYNGGSRVSIVPNALEYDGYKSVLLYIDEFTEAGLYTIYVTYGETTVDSSFVVEEAVSE